MKLAVFVTYCTKCYSLPNLWMLQCRLSCHRLTQWPPNYPIGLLWLPSRSTRLFLLSFYCFGCFFRASCCFLLWFLQPLGILPLERVSIHLLIVGVNEQGLWVWGGFDEKWCAGGRAWFSECICEAIRINFQVILNRCMLACTGCIYAYILVTCTELSAETKDQTPRG